jgi:F-type H+-transporting ATPase subunit alpha
LAAFAQFASDLDDATRAQLEHGQRVTELMKQSQYTPLSVAHMAISLFAAEKGYLKDVELNKVVDFEKSLHDYADAEHASLIAEINDKCELSDDISDKLTKLLDTFKSTQSW